MDYVLFAVFLVGGFFVGYWLRQQRIDTKIKHAEEKAGKILDDVKAKENELKLKAQDKALRIVDDAKSISPRKWVLAYSSKKFEKFTINSNAAQRKKTCPKCGPGIFMAEHKDRYHCGTCGYMEKR